MPQPKTRIFVSKAKPANGRRTNAFSRVGVLKKTIVHMIPKNLASTVMLMSLNVTIPLLPLRRSMVNLSHATTYCSATI